MPRSLYRYILRINRRGQLKLILLTSLVFPLSMVPLELQRRIVDDAIKQADYRLLWMLGAIYLLTLLVHGGFKFLMNLQRGRTIQHAKSHLRGAIFHFIYVVPESSRDSPGEGRGDHGRVVSMLSSEVEKLGQFIGESISVPLLQGGTMIAILGYMIWVEPVVALIGMAVYTPQMILIPLLQQRINANNREYAEGLRELGDFVVAEGDSEARHEGLPGTFRDLVRDMYHKKMRALWLKFVMKYARNFINALGPLSILLVGGWFAIEGETELGTIVAFLSGFEKISGPWTELIGFYRRVSDARMKYDLLLAEFPQVPEESEPVPQPELA